HGRLGIATAVKREVETAAVWRSVTERRKVVTQRLSVNGDGSRFVFGSSCFSDESGAVFPQQARSLGGLLRSQRNVDECLVAEGLSLIAVDGEVLAQGFDSRRL